jgi:hypothetical protein
MPSEANTFLSPNGYPKGCSSASHLTISVAEHGDLGEVVPFYCGSQQNWRKICKLDQHPAADTQLGS